MQQLKQVRSHWNRLSGLQQIAVVLIAVGVFFRFTNLDGKILWHDEVYTNFRAAGYLRGEVDATTFRNQVWTAAELQQFQVIKPGSTVRDTVRSLALEDPQHPPLYFVMARWWMQLFGGSITADRALPAVISLVSLPLMYALSLELFAVPAAALLATALLALSPFDILFAQTARQYSLMTLVVIASSWFLLRSIRTRRWSDWGLYAVATAVGFYAQPLFVLTPIAHGVYLAGLVVKEQVLPAKFSWEQKRYWQAALAYLGAIAIALLLFSPWAQVLRGNLGMASATTSWTRAIVPLHYLINLWVLSFTSLFIDLNIPRADVLTFLLRLPFVAMIAAALYVTCRKTRFPVWFFVLSSAFVPFVMLALPDLLLGGKRSAVSRYLIVCYPAIQLAVGYWMAHLQSTRWHPWKQVVLPGVVVASVASCVVSLFAPTWWSKDLSYFNAAIANYINTVQNPTVISDRGDDYTNTGDLISLSFWVEPDTLFYLVTDPPDLSQLAQSEAQDSTLLLFRPSKTLQTASKTNWTLEEVKPEWRLSQLSR